MKVVIADDSVLLREGLARLLTEAGFEVVGQAGDGEDLLRKVRAHEPDLALVDVRMPPTHTDEGLRAARELRICRFRSISYATLQTEASERRATKERH